MTSIPLLSSYNKNNEFKCRWDAEVKECYYMTKTYFFPIKNYG